MPVFRTSDYLWRAPLKFGSGSWAVAPTPPPPPPPPPPPAVTITLAGPSSGATGVAASFSVAPSGPLVASTIVTLAATNGAALSVPTLTFASGTTAAQSFTVTRATDGTSSVSITNDGGLTNIGTPISFVSFAAGLPSLVTGAASGTWVNIPAANTLLTVDPAASATYNQNYPSAAPWQGNSGIASVFNAWCGGCFDQATGSFWTNGAGGHGDYAGNASFKLVLRQSSPAWSMVGVPSGSVGQPAVTYADGQDATGLYSDGRPRSTHTWNSSVYAVGTGPILAGLSGVHSSGVDGPRRIIKFNETTGAASYGSVSTSSGSSTGVAACFDPSRGASGSIWRRWQGTSLIQRYDISADTWANVGAVQAWSGECSLTYLPTFDCILIGNGSSASGQSVTGGWCVFDCATGTYYFPTFTGAPALNSAGPGGFWPGNTQPAWVTALGAVCAWGNTSLTTTITKLTPGANPRTDAWTVGSLSVSGGNAVTPTAMRAAGTYGRFQHWQEAGGFVLLNEHNTPGYFFKL